MNYLKSLLSEDGHASTMRAMSLLCCVAAIVMGFIGLNKAVVDYSGLSLLCGTFLGAAFVGKIAQKSNELPKSDDK